jgi:hypothetical protein
VFRNTSDNTTGAQELTGSHPASPFDDFTANPGDTYYYWAKACNTAGCSEYSLYNTGWRAVAGTDYLIYLPLIMGGTGTSTSPIANGDFEQGHVAWTEDSNYGYYLIYEFDPGEAHSGTWLAYLLGQDIDNGVDRLSQTVTIPTTQPYLHFWYYIYSQDACGYDFARVKVNGTTKATLNLCSTNNTSDWRSYTVNLSAYAGNTVTLMFEATSDDVLDSYFYLDDILLSSSSSVYNIDKDSQQELDFSNLTKYKYP